MTGPRITTDERERIARAWLDAVAHDLEAEGYAIGAAVLPACSVGVDLVQFVAPIIGVAAAIILPLALFS